MIKICHFADFKQVIIKISQFTDIEQVITEISHQQNSLGRNWMPRHFFFWGHCPVSLALHRGFSDLWRSPPALSSTSTLVFLFECLGIQFFNSSHVTYGIPCRANLLYILNLYLYTSILEKLLLAVKTLIKNIEQQPN